VVGGHVGGASPASAYQQIICAQGQQAERHGALDGQLGAVAGLADAGDLAGVFEGDLDRPPRGIPFNQLGWVASRSVATSASS
jgi:hypothetical protein